MKITNSDNRGFTIVELLIVIVVIGILAAITIVAFNGIQQRARNTQVTSGVRTYIGAIKQYAVLNSGYPTQAGCLGEGYPDTYCWVGDSGTWRTYDNLDDEIEKVISTQPTLATERFSIGIGNNMRAGALYQVTGGHRIVYYLQGTSQTCLPGSTSTNEGGVVTQCVYRFPAL